MILLIIRFSTKVECGGLCLATIGCYAFEWVEHDSTGGKQCLLLAWKTGMCLDVNKKNPVVVHADNDNLPTECKGIRACSFIKCCISTIKTFVTQK